MNRLLVRSVLLVALAGCGANDSDPDTVASTGSPAAAAEQRPALPSTCSFLSSADVSKELGRTFTSQPGDSGTNQCYYQQAEVGALVVNIEVVRPSESSSGLDDLKAELSSDLDDPSFVDVTTIGDEGFLAVGPLDGLADLQLRAAVRDDDRIARLTLTQSDGMSAKELRSAAAAVLAMALKNFEELEL